MSSSCLETLFAKTKDAIRVFGLLYIWPIFLVCGIFSPPIVAEDLLQSEPISVIPRVEYEKRQGAEQRLEVLGDDLFGDGIDPSTGSIQFTHTDVSLPGNFPLEVAVRRKLSQGVYFRRNEILEFGDWQIDVPRITVVTPTSSRFPAWEGERCTGHYGTLFPLYVDSWSSSPNHNTLTGAGGYARDPEFQNDEYSNGLVLEAPKGGQILQIRGDTAPQMPSGTSHATPSGWRFECGVTANDGGQGFIGISPNGDEYTFNHYYNVRAGYLGSNVAVDALARTRHILAATSVKDVNGNTVSYNYDSLSRLTSISASDGRRIDLQYSGESRLIESVTTNPNNADEARTWSYTYNSSTRDDGLVGLISSNNRPYKIIANGRVTRSKTLTVVTLPDGRKWKLDLIGMDAEPGLDDECPQVVQNLSVTHPSGASARFRLSQKRRRVAEKHMEQLNQVNCPNEDFLNSPLDPWVEVEKYTRVFSVDYKSVDIPGVGTFSWFYKFEDAGISERANVTTITDPFGHSRKSYYYWTEEPLGGELKKVEYYSDGNSDPIRTEEYDYILDRSGFAILRDWSSAISVNNRVLQVDKRITQNNQTLTKSTTYNIDKSSNLYSFGQPLTVTQSASDGSPAREISTTYEHKKDIWRVGLPDTVSLGSTTVHDFDYDAKGTIRTL